MPVEVTEKDEVEWIEEGWLTKDGICQFPADVMGWPAGWKGHILDWSEAGIEEAFTNGWAVLIDSDGVAYEYADWLARYGDTRPDPLKVLNAQGRLRND